MVCHHHRFRKHHRFRTDDRHGIVQRRTKHHIHLRVELQQLVMVEFAQITKARIGTKLYQPRNPPVGRSTRDIHRKLPAHFRRQVLQGFQKDLIPLPSAQCAGEKQPDLAIGTIFRSCILTTGVLHLIRNAVQELLNLHVSRKIRSSKGSGIIAHGIDMVKEREELGQVPTARTLPVADPSFVQPAYFLRLDARHVLHQGNGDQSIEHDTVENRQELFQLSVAEQQARPHKRQDKEFNAQFIDLMLHRSCHQ